MSEVADLNLAVDLSAILNKRQEEAKVEEAKQEKAKQVPRPAGYRILCTVPEVEKVTAGGLHLPTETIRNEETLTTVLFVVSMGPDCYKDPARFPSGPWCKEGDFILIRPHAGSRLVIHGREFRIINDDSVEGVVDDPRGIKRK
jgi:co-chaperonin GroES (HSP10)